MKNNRIQFALVLSAISASSAVNLPSARAQATVEGVRVGLGEQATYPRFRAGTWTPVFVDVKAGRAGFRGTVAVEMSDEDGVPVVARRPVELRADELRTVVLYGRPGSRYTDVTARVADADGRPLGRPTPVASGEAVEGTTRLVFAIGKPGGLERLPELDKHGGMRNTASADLAVVPVRRFPDAPQGFDAADTVVLDTNDPWAMAELRKGGLAPLRDWVRRGGHLVVAVGQNWQEARELLDPMAPAKEGKAPVRSADALLPARPVETVRLNDPREVEVFAGAVKRPIEPPVPAAKFADWEARDALILAATSTTPLVVRGPFGLGRVTLVGLDVDRKPFSDWPDSPLFWDKALDLRGRPAAAAMAGGPMPGGAFYQGDSPDLARRLQKALEAFQGVRLVPFGWVAFFVFVYILLIGPGDYLFLRRVVKRMEWTWVTFPLIVAGVSIAAYAAAYAIKGSDLLVNKVDAIDIDQVGGRVRGTTWVTLFSPREADYGVALKPLPAGTGPGASADPRATEVLLSWFGAPEGRLGAGRGGPTSYAGSGYSYAPAGAAEALEGVRVPIWSTKSFQGRWAGPAGPAVEAQIDLVGGDRVSGTVTNLLDRPLRDARLLYGRHAYDLRTVPPGGTARVDPTAIDSISTYMSKVAGGFGRDRTARAGLPAEPGAARPDGAARAALVRALMFHDGLGSSLAAAYPSLPLHDLDLTGLLELKRPMLIADLDGAGVELDLSHAPDTPKTFQTTVLRVVLPPPGAAAR